jgi:hypothetical protein
MSAEIKVVLMHTPEFAFEHDVDHVRRAAKETAFAPARVRRGRARAGA